MNTSLPESPTTAEAGRSCPLHYRYRPAVFARPAEFACDVLYVVGGLYGNRPALASVLELAAAEPGRTAVVFNGDFNWFNVDQDGFESVNRTVLGHIALRGNVETELAADDASAGMHLDARGGGDVAANLAQHDQLVRLHARVHDALLADHQHAARLELAFEAALDAGRRGERQLAGHFGVGAERDAQVLP